MICVCLDMQKQYSSVSPIPNFSLPIWDIPDIEWKIQYPTLRNSLCLLIVNESPRAIDTLTQVLIWMGSSLNKQRPCLMLCYPYFSQLLAMQKTPTYKGHSTKEDRCSAFVIIQTRNLDTKKKKKCLKWLWQTICP